MVHPIIGPIIALMALTFLVWTVMYARRLSFMFANRVSPQQVETPGLINSVLPEYVNRPSNNLKNLFEMPVIFYAAGAVALALAKDDGVLTWLAWGFVLLRAVHSAIQCTSNVVRYRFAAYALSSIVLMLMVVRLAMLAAA